MTTNNRTLDLDRLFIRELVFRDASNRPISSNKTLVTRGDGGIYFKDPESGRLNSFNTMQAGANIKVEAGGASNTLWLEPGAGIAYTSIVDGVQPKIFISAIAPEQITIRGGETLKFTSLYDVIDGGRTLYFAGKGDTTVAISDATIVIGSAANSSYTAIQSLTSTTKSMIANQSTLTNTINSTLNTVNLATTANTISQFGLALDKLSTFVYSTFTKDAQGNNTVLNINAVNTRDISARDIGARNISALDISTNTIKTSTITIGANMISNSNLPVYNASQDGIGIVSTTTNLITFQDNYTGVKNGFEKEYMNSISTFGTTRYNTQSQNVQLGFYPMFSTQGSLTQPNPNSQFVPVIQQIELLQKTVYNNGLTSTQTKYAVRNIGRFDELYPAGSMMYLGGNIVISTLTVSSINFAVPGTGTGSGSGTNAGIIINPGVNNLIEIVSTYTTMYIGQIEPHDLNSSVTISSITASTINGRPYGIFDSIAFSTATAYTANISSLAVYNAVATYISSQSLSSAQGYITLLNFSSAVGKQANILDISTSTIKYNLAEGVTTNTLFTSTGGLRFGDGTATSLNLLTLSSGALTYDAATGKSISSQYISTGGLQFGNGVAASLNLLTLSSGALTYDAAAGKSLSSQYISTGALRFGSGDAASLNLLTLSSGALTYDAAAGKSISSQYISTGGLQFGNGTAASLNLLTLSSGALTYDAAAGKSISSQYVSTGGLRFGDGTATSLNLLTLSYDAASGKSLSSQYISTGDLQFGNGTAASLNLLTLSSDSLTYDAASGKSVSSQYISTGGLRFGNGDATSLNLLTLSSGQIGFDIAFGVTISTTNAYAAQIQASSINGNVARISSVTAHTVNVTYVSSYAISSYNTSSELLTFGQGVGSSLAMLTTTTGQLYYGNAAGTSISTVYMSTGELYVGNGTCSSLTAVNAWISTAVINDLLVNTINGITPGTSSFSTLQWGSAVGNKATISSLRVSTIMGVDLPILTFDMQNRRVGLNLGATQQPRATLDISGIVYANNFVTSSDRRLKANIRPLEAPVEIPQAYRYNWIEGGAEDIGVMADEIEAIAPECVYTRPDGYKAVSYSKLVPVVLTLLRGLSLRVAQLENSAGR